MTSLLATVSALVAAELAPLGIPAELARVTVSDRPDLGHFQTNAALAAAKALKQNPKALAEAAAERLRARPELAEVTVAGPGFVNLKLADAGIAAWARAAAGDAHRGLPVSDTPQTVIIDFGGPNVAKAMHVGHLRSTVIGDSLQRLFRALGHKVVSDVHLGDWGKQMGQLIDAIRLREPSLPYFDPAASGPYPDESPVSMDDLEVIYPAASAACKEDPARDEAARAATAELQAGRAGYVALWRHFVRVSQVGLMREFAALGVTFDEWKGESDADPLIADMVADLKARGLAVPDQGALVIHVAREDDKRKIPPLIVVSRDGSAQYATTDLATIIDRVRTHDPHLVLYVVGQPQHEHFEKVFRAAALAGYAGRATLEHVGFGTVNGPDGKPFRTRAGGTVKLFDLIEMAKAEAAKRLDETGLGAGYPPEERAGIARMVGIGAIKFADLVNHRLTDYIFDLERFTQFEGKTGPYLQYTVVRIRSLLRKAGEQGIAPAAGAITIAGEAERDLALKLAQGPEVLETAAAKRTPNTIAEHAFGVAQAYSRFYAAHHILSEEDAALRASRLALSGLVADHLAKLLDILGIEVPPRM